MIVVVAAVLGLVAGPFIRLLVDRVPDRLPLFARHAERGGSATPRDLAPVLSWGSPTTPATVVPVGSPDDADDPADRPRVRARWRAPVIDVVTAVVLASLAARFGWSGQLAAMVVWGCALVAVSVIDLDHYRIPTILVYPTLLACAAALTVVAFAESIPRALLGAALGALAYGGFIFLFWLVYPAGMGFGDVRLAVLLGLVLGWVGAAQEVDGVLVDAGLLDPIRLFLFGGLAGSMLGSLVGIGVMAIRGRRAHFPFGPSLCLGALAVVLASEALLA